MPYLLRRIRGAFLRFYDIWISTGLLQAILHLRFGDVALVGANYLGASESFLVDSDDYGYLIQLTV